MKKLSILGICAIAMATATAAHADTQSNDTTALSGPYVGVYGGYDWTDTDGFNSNLNGWDGGIFAGYKFDKIMDYTSDFGIGSNLAIEGFYGVSNSDGRTGTTIVEKDQEWGVSLRPGISVFDKLAGQKLGINPYGIFGYRRTEFDSNAAVPDSEWYDGFELGIGTELVAYGDVGVRMEYSHTWYGSENGVDPASDDIRMGLSYHF